MMRFLFKNISFLQLAAVCFVVVHFPNVTLAYESIDDANIRSIVGEWVSDRSETELTYGPISNWNTSRVTDMTALFISTSNFNEDLSGWDTSSVTTMRAMFYNASNFSANVANWDTSSVITIALLFFSTSNFSSDVSRWDMSSATQLLGLFAFTSNFSSDLSTWDTSRVTTMKSMFYLTSNFTADVSTWDTSSVTNMASLFKLSSNFASYVSRWNTSSVTDMDSMFSSNFTTFASPQVLCWQLDNLDSKLDLCSMETVYLDCTCAIPENYVACPRCYRPENEQLVTPTTDDEEIPPSGSSPQDGKSSSSAPSIITMTRGCGLVSAVIAYMFFFDK